MEVPVKLTNTVFSSTSSISFVVWLQGDVDFSAGTLTFERLEQIELTGDSLTAVGAWLD